MIPKIFLGEWKTTKGTDSETHSDTIRHLVSYEFQKMSKLVYLGSHSSDQTMDQINADVVFEGSLELTKAGISFVPKVSFPKLHKSYKSEAVNVSWEQIGTAPTIIVREYMHLLSERVRLGRILLTLPDWNDLPLDTNPEILASSEYLTYKTIFDPKVSLSEKTAILNSLKNTIPNAPFLKYEFLLHNLTSPSSPSLKEIWKDWTDSRFVSAHFGYLLAYQLAETYEKAGDTSSALDFYQIVRKAREDHTAVYHPEYADTLSRIGRILVSQGKNEEALFYFTAAKEMFQSLSLSNSKSELQNQLHFSLLLAILGQKEVALSEFFDMEKSIKTFSRFEQALFYFNFARLEYSMKAYDASIIYAQKSKQILYELNQTNHELSFHLILLTGADHFQLNQFNLAQNEWEEISHAKLFLPLEDTSFYRYSLLNLAFIYQMKGSSTESEFYYKQYTRLTPYNAIIPLESKPNIQVSNFIQPGNFEEPKLDEFTKFEENVIKSYTGRYIFTGQDEEIRARTYQDRLEDTNEFLRDLLQSDFFGTQSLAFLKDTLFPPNQSYEKGDNIIFIDIGPALNNLDAPGITSQSVAYHFPKMTVILWELPTEVDLFLKKVPAEKKEELYSFQNVRILSADGVGEFMSSYQDANRWILKNRNVPKLKGKTIILRAANSIDIYETYSKIQPHFKDVAKSLKENPVLYFFNRSILLKPEGEEKFTLIGYQSVRGFHHNSQSLDRNGEPPYTLAKYTLSGK